MIATARRVCTITLMLTSAVAGVAQSSELQPEAPHQATLPSPIASTAVSQTEMTAPPLSPAVLELTSFKESDVKFQLPTLLGLLRDRKHEGWVLAAYPDPKTSQPLIGAGVSLDLPAREHIQRDSLNPHQFLEPSSAEIWQAAGLDPERLRKILDEFNQHLAASNARQFRHQIWDLPSQITDEEAESLLRVAAIQAIYNAKAYCRNFDRLTSSQQMAMSQLVYQMGVNLEEFSQFLNLVNREANESSQARAIKAADSAYWKEVQLSLVQSQWARLYRVRAASVIAMLNPNYQQNPTGAEHSISRILRPAVVHGRRGRGRATLRLASYSRAHSAARQRKSRLKSQ